jgi:hypothetical protein
MLLPPKVSLVSSTHSGGSIEDKPANRFANDVSWPDLQNGFLADDTGHMLKSIEIRDTCPAG